MSSLNNRSAQAFHRFLRLKSTWLRILLPNWRKRLSSALRMRNC